MPPQKMLPDVIPPPPKIRSEPVPFMSTLPAPMFIWPTVSFEKFTSLIWPSRQDATIVTLFALMVLILSAVSVPVKRVDADRAEVVDARNVSWPLKLSMVSVATRVQLP